MKWLLLLLALTGCGAPTACLSNAYDGTQPQRECTSAGIPLP